jgi:hypothetical protein
VSRADERHPGSLMGLIEELVAGTVFKVDDFVTLTVGDQLALAADALVDDDAHDPEKATNVAQLVDCWNYVRDIGF